MLEDKFGSHFTRSELKKITKDIEKQKLDVDYLLDRYSITQDKESKNFAEDYEKMRKNILDISTPQAYLESTYSPSEIDEDYNILSTYNLQTKFDYYDIVETYTIKDLKKKYQEKIDNFDEELYRLIWRYKVHDDKTLEKKYSHAELIHILWGEFSKEELLKVYRTEDIYINVKKNYPMLSYCVVTPDDWHEPGEVGWFGTSNATAQSERDFAENYYNEFIAPYEDDMEVYLLDCHI